MKRILLTSVVLASSLLAACGGGGSTPGPLPSTQPHVTYTAQLLFVGVLGGRTLQGDLRAVQLRSPMAASANAIPIMVVSPITTQGNVGAVYGGIGGDVEVQVSPQPTSSPAVTFSNTNAHAKLATPAPGTPQPLPSGVVAQNPIFSDGTPNVQSAGAASAQIGPPVNQTATASVYTYLPISLECILQHPGSASAWQWTGSAWATTDLAHADIYMSGPNCALASSEANAILHIPGGFTTFSTDVSFAGLTASQWTNTQTTLDMSTATQLNADGSTNDVIVGKTADGTHVFKLFPVSVGMNEEYSGAVEVAGAGVDGF